MNAQPNACCGELDHGEIVCRELFVAGGDTSEVLNPVEEALDAVALAVEGSASSSPTYPRPPNL
jgi:hypothetical protein